MKNTLKIFIVLFSLISCSHEQDKSIEYIIFGEVCGECDGHCATMFKLDNSYLIRDTSDNYFHNNSNLESGLISGDTLNPILFNKAKDLTNNLPEFLLKSGEKTFGEPDNHDQCGIYIQFKNGGEIKSFVLDTDLNKVPIELHEYLRRIMTLTREIQE